ILTIGFARRFATYKRAALFFRDQERLKRILNDPDRPVQIVVAGKAHPADEPGKGLIQYIYQMSRQPGFAGHIIFVEDYDINLARHLVSGTDVWMNTPRRPMEASGTSGMKAGQNGVPNFSILDGWWIEGFDGANGWAIGEEREYQDETAQDEADALSLYRILEDEIVPRYYDRGEDGVPHGWLEKMRAAMASVAPRFSLARMLKEYVAQYYVPGGILGARLARDGYASARTLAAWDERIRAAWPQITIHATGLQQSEIHVGQSLPVKATLDVGALSASDVAVELVYGHGQDGDLIDAKVLPMQCIAQSGRDGLLDYRIDFTSPDSGLFTYGVRVRPQHADLPNPFALSLTCWA
ncbi:MAG TPA: alpha-glucan family phosphorylase, partial [Anaerolineae bacterium]